MLLPVVLPFHHPSLILLLVYKLHFVSLHESHSTVSYEDKKSLVLCLSWIFEFPSHCPGFKLTVCFLNTHTQTHAFICEHLSSYSLSLVAFTLKVEWPPLSLDNL